MNGELRHALDTSFVVTLLRGAVGTERRPDETAIPIPVLGELRFGALNSRDPERKLTEIEQLVSRTIVVPCTPRATRASATTRKRRLTITRRRTMAGAELAVAERRCTSER